MEVEEPEIELEDGTAKRRGVRICTLGKQPPVKRRASVEDMAVDEDRLKAQRLTDDSDMGMRSIRKEKAVSEGSRILVAGTLFGVETTDVYSPDRVARVAKKFGLVSGSSMDLTNGCECEREDHKRLAWRRVREEAPYVLIGSPPARTSASLRNSTRLCMGTNRGGQRSLTQILRKRSSTSNSAAPCTSSRYSRADTSCTNTHGQRDPGECLASQTS